VDDIETRATIVNTREGHKVVIPNAVLFTNPVDVAGRSERSARRMSA